MDPIAVIDFETTGLSPGEGARATEVAAVIVQDGNIVSRYQSLMNAGVHVPGFITNLTGITNAMVQDAPAARQVMDELCKFLGPLPLVAHNASFDKKFFENECHLASITHESQFACSMLVARRLFPGAPNHKLGTLVNHLKIRKTGQFHRALSDAEMTAQVVLEIYRKLSEDHNISHPSHAMLRKLQRTKYAEVGKILKHFGKTPSSEPTRSAQEVTAKPKARSAKKRARATSKTGGKINTAADNPRGSKSKIISKIKKEDAEKARSGTDGASPVSQGLGANEEPQNYSAAAPAPQSPSPNVRSVGVGSSSSADQEAAARRHLKEEKSDFFGCLVGFVVFQYPTQYHP